MRFAPSILELYLELPLYSGKYSSRQHGELTRIRSCEPQVKGQGVQMFAETYCWTQPRAIFIWYRRRTPNSLARNSFSKIQRGSDIAPGVALNPSLFAIPS